MLLQEFHRTVMDLPRRYVVFHHDGTHEETDHPHGYATPPRSVLIDTRYTAKMRLYWYARKKYGLPITPYRPYAGTEIGKTIPILNF